MKKWRDITGIAALRLLLAAIIMLQAGLSATAMARMDASRLASGNAGGHAQGKAGNTVIELVICSPDGLKTVTLANAAPKGTDGHIPAHDNCECPCATLCAALAFASVDNAQAGRMVHPLATCELTILSPTRSVGAPGPLLAGRPSHPRAPPAAG